jgi:acetyl-CoA hydrolase
MASGGRAILALPATAKGRSRIVPTFAAGTRVSVPAPEAGIVVTEHGVADLGDLDAAARAEALIAIAAPEHRAALRAAACATVRA